MSDIYLANFTLSQSINLHSGAVRCLSAHEEYLLTGSYDKSLILSQYSSVYEPARTYTHHSAAVYACHLIPNSAHFVSSDQLGMIYTCNFEGSFSLFASQAKAVSSLDYEDGKLLSGCWDGSGKLWDVNSKTELVTLDPSKHSHAVTVRFTPFGILTGSQNGLLNFWTKEGKFVRSVKVHDDIIKKIQYSEDLGIVTCSNDSTLKRITNDGRILDTYTGHSGFLFSCCVMGMDVISAGDDKTVKVWRDSRCADSITHPDSVWDVCSNYKGDIITAGGDYSTRVFTLDKDRIANEAELEEFNKKTTAVEVQGSDNIDLSKYPSIDRIAHLKGKTQGDFQIFNNNGVGEVYMWHVDGQYWEKIGEALGSAGDSQKENKRNYPGDRFFPAGEYEYVFDVDLGNGDVRKLPYNNWENPLEVAEKFLTKEGLGRGYVQEICKFINDNAKPTCNKPAPKPQQAKAKHFPTLEPIVFTTGNLDQIGKKLVEFNATVQTGIQMDAAEIRMLERIVQAMSKSQNSSLTVKELELVIGKLLKWPKEIIFPCLDLYRFVLLGPGGQEFFKTSDHGAEHIAHIANIVERCNENPPIITGLRVICNMFNGSNSSYSMETLGSTVLDSVLNHVSNTNKQVRLGLITILYNYSVKVARKRDETVKQQILTSFLEILTSETDNDNIYRALVTVGNLVFTQSVERDMVEFAKGIDLEGVIQGIKCTGKALEVKSEVLAVFSLV